MQSNQWEKSLAGLLEVLRALSARDNSGTEFGSAGLGVLAAHPLDLARKGGRAFFAGNGASASMACHFSTDLAKNAGLRTMVFTDPALLTCVGNDFSYEDIFAEPLSWHMSPGDLAVLVSSSRNSPNVLKDARRGRELGGVVVTFSAMRPDNALRGLGDFNIDVPADSYSHAETSHAAILHHWVDAIMRSKALG